MGHHSKHTTVTAGGGYKSEKDTALYSPDNAPINNQDSERKEEVTGELKESPKEGSIKRVVLESAKPEKELHITEDFLNTISQVYISGRYAVKGYVNLRIKQIIDLLLQNTGGYHVVVPPSLKRTLVDIIQYGKDSLLGRSVSQ
jgi:hypothetical protein